MSLGRCPESNDRSDVHAMPSRPAARSAVGMCGVSGVSMSAPKETHTHWAPVSASFFIESAAAGDWYSPREPTHPHRRNGDDE